MKKSLVVLLVLHAAVFRLAAQATMADVLRSAQNDLRVQESRQLADAANQLRFHVPIIKSMEGRVGINGSALGDTIYGYIRNEDAYGLIIGTNSLREIKRQKQYKQAKIGVYAAEQSLYLDEALYERYRVLVDWYYARVQTTHLRKLTELYAKKQDILRISAEKGMEIKAKEVINTQEDWLEASSEARKAEYQLSLSKRQIADFLKQQTETELDTADFISLRQISITLSTLDSAVTVSGPESAVRQSLTNYAQAKQSYANAQNRQIFKDLRLGYENPLFLTRPNKFNTTNNLSIRVGLSVPLPGNNRFRNSEAKLDLLEAKLSETRNKSNTTTILKLYRDQISQLFALHTDFEQQKKTNLINDMLQNATLRNALSPMEIVELEIAQESLSARSIDTAHDITKAYIELMRYAGQMTRAPYVNLLSESGAGW